MEELPAYWAASMVYYSGMTSKKYSALSVFQLEILKVFDINGLGYQILLNKQRTPTDSSGPA